MGARLIRVYGLRWSRKMGDFSVRLWQLSQSLAEFGGYPKP